MFDGEFTSLKAIRETGSLRVPEPIKVKGEVFFLFMSCHSIDTDIITSIDLGGKLM